MISMIVHEERMKHDSSEHREKKDKLRIICKTVREEPIA
jgi:hypothetical protein